MLTTSKFRERSQAFLVPFFHFFGGRTMPQTAMYFETPVFTLPGSKPKGGVDEIDLGRLAPQEIFVDRIGIGGAFFTCAAIIENTVVVAVETSQGVFFYEKEEKPERYPWAMAAAFREAVCRYLGLGFDGWNPKMPSPQLRCDFSVGLKAFSQCGEAGWYTFPTELSPENFFQEMGDSNEIDI
jgi:hypothetical protein